MTYAIGSVRKRGAVWWMRYTVARVRYQESTHTGDEREARACLAQLRRDVRDGVWRPPAERRAETVRAQAQAVQRAQEQRAAIEAHRVERRTRWRGRPQPSIERMIRVDGDPRDSVYFFRETGSLNVKIGYTSGRVERRLAQIKSGLRGADLSIEAVIVGGIEELHERIYHEAFAARRISGEWFSLAPAEVTSFLDRVEQDGRAHMAPAHALAALGMS